MKAETVALLAALGVQVGKSDQDELSEAYERFCDSFSKEVTTRPDCEQAAIGLLSVGCQRVDSDDETWQAAVRRAEAALGIVPLSNFEE